MTCAGGLSAKLHSPTCNGHPLAGATGWGNRRNPALSRQYGACGTSSAKTARFQDQERDTVTKSTVGGDTDHITTSCHDHCVAVAVPTSGHTKIYFRLKLALTARILFIRGCAIHFGELRHVTKWKDVQVSGEEIEYLLMHGLVGEYRRVSAEVSYWTRGEEMSRTWRRQQHTVRIPNNLKPYQFLRSIGFPEHDVVLQLERPAMKILLGEALREVGFPSNSRNNYLPSVSGDFFLPATL
ncbi:hypothetical protein AAG570_006217 [Ranatra chinensis]|uniref:Uncharacterized protein n=1 Tax=Ranatra chinensis TaxID=642074 RepID=A0ABD0YTF1_9HEMI